MGYTAPHGFFWYCNVWSVSINFQDTLKKNAHNEHKQKAVSISVWWLIDSLYSKFQLHWIWSECRMIWIYCCVTCFCHCICNTAELMLTFAALQKRWAHGIKSLMRTSGGSALWKWRGLDWGFNGSGTMKGNHTFNLISFFWFGETMASRPTFS